MSLFPSGKNNDGTISFGIHHILGIYTENQLPGKEKEKIYVLTIASYACECHQVCGLSL